MWLLTARTKLYFPSLCPPLPLSLPSLPPSPHLVKMSKSTHPQPCTNVPIECTACPRDPTPHFVWKYNMVAHWKMEHKKEKMPNDLAKAIRMAEGESEAVKDVGEKGVVKKKKAKTAKAKAKAKPTSSSSSSSSSSTTSAASSTSMTITAGDDKAE